MYELMPCVCRIRGVEMNAYHEDCQRHNIHMYDWEKREREDFMRVMERGRRAIAIAFA